jgi:hypothetical protein
MFLRNFVLSLSVLFITAIVTVSLVYAATYNAQCYPAKPKWVQTGTCTRNLTYGNCEGIITFQHHVIKYECDTNETGSCTESEVMMSTYPNTYTVVCPSNGWIPETDTCTVPTTINTTNLPSVNVVYESCF